VESSAGCREAKRSCVRRPRMGPDVNGVRPTAVPRGEQDLVMVLFNVQVVQRLL
jgi:hypothetical protein